MISTRDVGRIVCAFSVMVLILSCGESLHPAVKIVDCFYREIGAIEAAKTTEEGRLDITEGANTLSEIYRTYTTTSGIPGAFSMMDQARAAGLVRYTNLNLELVTETGDCAVVKVTGDVALQGETEKLSEEHVVIREEGEWLIDLYADACD